MPRTIYFEKEELASIANDRTPSWGCHAGLNLDAFWMSAESELPSIAQNALWIQCCCFQILTCARSHFLPWPPVNIRSK